MKTLKLTLACVLAAGAAHAEITNDERLAQPFGSDALATSWQESLPVDERLAGLALLWSEAKYNFANFDMRPDLDWDAAYLAAIPRVMAAASTEAYYRELQRLVAQLGDGHSNVYPPQELRDRFYSRPPLYTRLVEGRVMIYLVDSRRLQAIGLRAGQEVVSIDGVPVREYVAQHVDPFVSASTPQDRDVRRYNYELLRGPSERSIKLGVVDADGNELTVDVARAGYGGDDDAEPYPGLYSVEDLGDGVLRLDIRSFEDASVVEAFEADWPRLRQARGLIIDLRINGGGSSDIGYRILDRLTAGNFPVSAWKTRLYRPSIRAWQRDDAWAWDAYPADTWIEEIEESYDGPVAVVTGPRTFSAAEDFLVAFRQAQRGLIIGQASGGSTGQPLMFSLPGGGTARICSKRDTFTDGTEFVGVGVQPDIEVVETVADLRAGRDAAVKRAKAEVLKGQP